MAPCNETQVCNDAENENQVKVGVARCAAANHAHSNSLRCEVEAQARLVGVASPVWSPTADLWRGGRGQRDGGNAVTCFPPAELRLGHEDNGQVGLLHFPESGFCVCVDVLIKLEHKRARSRGSRAPSGPAPELPVSRLPWRLPVLELVTSIRDPGGPRVPFEVVLCVFIPGIREYSGLRFSADVPALPGKSELFGVDPLLSFCHFSFQTFY